MRRMLTTRFTPEDHDVLAMLVLHRRGGFSWLSTLLVQSYEADTRDADLMRRIAKTRAAVDAMLITNEPFKATVHSLIQGGHLL